MHQPFGVTVGGRSWSKVVRSVQLDALESSPVPLILDGGGSRGSVLHQILLPALGDLTCDFQYVPVTSSLLL